MVRIDGPFARQGQEYPGEFKQGFCLLVSESVRQGLSVSVAINNILDEEIKSTGAKLQRAERVAAKRTGRRGYYRWREEILDMTDPERSLRRDLADVGINVMSVELKVHGHPVPLSYNSVLAPHPRRGRPRKRRV